MALGPHMPSKLLLIWGSSLAFPPAAPQSHAGLTAPSSTGAQTYKELIKEGASQPLARLSLEGRRPDPALQDLDPTGEAPWPPAQDGRADTYLYRKGATVAVLGWLYCCWG